MAPQGAGLMLADQRGNMQVGACIGDVEALELFEVEHQEGPGGFCRWSQQSVSPSLFGMTFVLGSSVLGVLRRGWAPVGPEACPPRAW